MKENMNGRAISPNSVLDEIVMELEGTERALTEAVTFVENKCEELTGNLKGDETSGSSMPISIPPIAPYERIRQLNMNLRKLVSRLEDSNAKL